MLCPKPCAHCLPWAVFHTYNVFTAGWQFSFGVFVNMHVPNHRPGSQPGSPNPCSFPPASLRRVPHQLCTRHLVLLGWPAPQAPHASVNYNPGGFVLVSLRLTFPWGLEFCFRQKSIHRRQSGSIFHLLRLEAKVKVVPAGFDKATRI